MSLHLPSYREPKWLPSFDLTGAIFSLRELWLPCSRVFVFTGLKLESANPCTFLKIFLYLMYFSNYY